MSTNSDRELWTQALTGEASAFGELFERHATSVYNYVFRRCGNWATAEDLTSLVFLETWRKPDKVELVHDSALPYLLGVATNVLRNRSRTERRFSSALARLAALTDTESASEDVSERLAEEQRMKDILLVLGRLPRQQQDAIVLCIWMGLTYEEAAVALRLPVGTVRSRLSRGKRRLRELLEGCGYSAAGLPEYQEGQDVTT
jgi:RNA polymerase sigma factor (sigma-70 family)